MGQNVERVSCFLQDEMRRRGSSEVTAVEAAGWLHNAGLLKNSASRPGLPLRELLRAGVITGQIQQANGRWLIRRVRQTAPSGSSMTENPAGPVLPDLLRPGLKVVFVGTAVGDTSARRQHYYSHPGNSFYGSIYAAGIVPVLLRPEEDRRLLDYGVGLTDVVKDQHTGNDTELQPVSPAERRALWLRLQQCRPKILCFNGKNAFKLAMGRPAASYGTTRMFIAGAAVYVVPSTSGRVGEYQVLEGRTRDQWFRELSALVKGEPLSSDSERGDRTRPKSGDARC